jgi:hypothetical protein
MGLLSMLVTVLAISGIAYARGGLMYSPGPLNAQSGAMLGGVASHAETRGRCEACHGAPWTSVRMADLCVDCHGEIAVQMGDMVALHGAMYQKEPKLECRACHPEHNGTDAPLTNLQGGDFPHELLGFSLNGHSLTVQKELFACADCHHEDLSTFSAEACEACHRQMDPVFAQAHLLSFGAACLDCHDGVDRLSKKNFNHNVFSFKLTGRHASVACAKCHVNARGYGDFEVTLQDCYSCHFNDDPHETRFGTDCSACHTADGWEEATFDHNRSNFPLTGAHASLACEACHTAGQFAGLSAQCASCHADPDFHLGAFSANCADCHSTTAWVPAQFNLSHPEPRVDEEGSGINHGFTTCRTCHPSTVREYTCLACHSDNQGGEGGEHEGGE